MRSNASYLNEHLDLPKLKSLIGRDNDSYSFRFVKNITIEGEGMRRMWGIDTPCLKDVILSDEAFEMRDTCHVKSHVGMFHFTCRRWSVEVLLSLNLFEFVPNHNPKLILTLFISHTLP